MIMSPVIILSKEKRRFDFVTCNLGRFPVSSVISQGYRVSGMCFGRGAGSEDQSDWLFSNSDLQLTLECFTTGWESSRTRSELPVGKRMVHGLQVGGESRFKVVLVGVDKPAGHAGGIRNHLT